MDCPAESTIETFLDGELAGDAARELRDHLGECTRCTGIAAELEVVADAVRHGAIGSTDAACPDDEQLAAFVDGAGKRSARKLIDAHLETCAVCRDAIELLRELQGEHADLKVAADAANGDALAGVGARERLLASVGVARRKPADEAAKNDSKTIARPRTGKHARRSATKIAARRRGERERLMIVGLLGGAIAVAAAVILVVMAERIDGPSVDTGNPAVAGRPDDGGNGGVGGSERPDRPDDAGGSTTPEAGAGRTTPDAGGGGETRDPIDPTGTGGSPDAGGAGTGGGTTGDGGTSEPEAGTPERPDAGDPDAGETRPEVPAPAPRGIVVARASGLKVRRGDASAAEPLATGDRVGPDDAIVTRGGAGYLALARGGDAVPEGEIAPVEMFMDASSVIGLTIEESGALLCRLEDGGLLVDIAQPAAGRPSKPLALETRGVRLTAEGTRFAVRAAGRAELRLAVEEGRLRMELDDGAPPRVIASGEGARVRAGKVTPGEGGAAGVTALAGRGAELEDRVRTDRAREAGRRFPSAFARTLAAEAITGILAGERTLAPTDAARLLIAIREGRVELDDAALAGLRTPLEALVRDEADALGATGRTSGGVSIGALALALGPDATGDLFAAALGRKADAKAAAALAAGMTPLEILDAVRASKSLGRNEAKLSRAAVGKMVESLLRRQATDGPELELAKTVDVGAAGFSVPAAVRRGDAARTAAHHQSARGFGAPQETAAAVAALALLAADLDARGAAAETLAAALRDGAGALATALADEATAWDAAALATTALAHGAARIGAGAFEGDLATRGLELLDSRADAPTQTACLALFARLDAQPARDDAPGVIVVRRGGELEVSFVFVPAKRTKTVALVGTFTEWDARPIRMARHPDRRGAFVATLRLPAGRHTYKFVVDGAKEWVSDPHNPLREDDQFGGANSVLLLPSR